MDRYQKFSMAIQKVVHILLMLLGQFPFTYDHAKRTYTFKLFSWLSTWTAITYTYYFFGCQAFFSFLLNDIVNTYGTSTRSFHHVILILLLFLIVVHMLISCFVWLTSGYKLVSIDNECRAFVSPITNLHAKVETTERPLRSHRSLVAVLMVWGFISATLNAMSSKQIMAKHLNMLLESKVSTTVTKMFPPLIFFVIQDVETCSVLSAIVVAIMHFTAAISEMSVLIVARRLVNHLEDVIVYSRAAKKTRDHPRELFHVSRVVGTVIYSDEKKKSKVRQDSLDLDGIKLHLKVLKDMFGEFAEASQGIILLEVATNMIVVAVTIFHTLISLTQGGLRANSFELALLLVLLQAIFKLIVLTNTGERWVGKTAEFREALAGIECDPELGMERHMKLVHLNQYASTLDFRLSGCGFFTLGREALTAIVGSIVTYTIVLIQFDPDKDKRR